MHPFPHNKLSSARLLQAGVVSNDETRGKCFLRSYMYMELTQHGDRDRLILSGQPAVHHVVAWGGWPQGSFAVKRSRLVYEKRVESEPSTSWPIVPEGAASC